MKRGYGQWCPVARALDMVGERWTLLVIRELLGGPRRFRDLMDGLPGIGTNLLTDRLSSLREGGLIEKRVLPPPAGSTVYELTERGRNLAPVLSALGKWGVELMTTRLGKDEFRAHWLLVAGMTRFDARAARGLRVRCEVRAGDEDVAHFAISEGKLRVAQGPADQPDVSVRADAPTLAAMFMGDLSPEDALNRGRAKFEGDHETLRKVLLAFPPPADQGAKSARG
jgi:DNA-binding HxlR family transcriptional regulator/putative sterol carrier protein